MPLRVIVFVASSFALRITLRSFFCVRLADRLERLLVLGRDLATDLVDSTVAPIAKLIGIEVMYLTFEYHCSATAATGEL